MALLSVIIWGTSFLISKNLMNILTPAQLMWIRFLIAYVTLWILHPKWRVQWKEEVMFFVMSLFANTLYFLAENTALQLTQTSNVSILVTTAPIFAALILRVTKKIEKIPARQILGYLIAFVGVVLVVLNGVFNLQLSPAGDLLALGAALAWAINGILLQRCSGRYNSFFVTRKVMFYALLTSTPIVLIERRPVDFSALATAPNILSLLYLGVICSAACYVMWNRSIGNIGVLTTNIYIYAIPMVTLIAGALLLNETVTWLSVAGICLVIGGMAFSALKKKADNP